MRLSFDHYLLSLVQEAGATLKLGDGVSDSRSRSIVTKLAGALEQS
jgi:hypothetical protein